ncbi:hypothetical protein O7627_24330 [Solwaraspora sp. WMMD1047]|uniref:hypothetical protein n=1 Tax=Solwaraspora sp. WMMD1047 TaxID=3016102 RepID=UPI0024177B8C|nr:hypothetical protein [Solwaraspora sp. WMMD1047]MDG4832411.1 hypothetical protein [Solwaraspora sp. WMMD1047]
MITVQGEEYGTRAEIAARLTQLSLDGDQVTAETVRNWDRNGDLKAYRILGANGRPEVRYRWRDAARVEAAKRRSARGRKRRVDGTPMIAA